MEETQFPEDFRDFLRLLEENEVEYLLIGGYAVGFHGYPRATLNWTSGSASGGPAGPRAMA
jgi:hypothetical protein